MLSKDIFGNAALHYAVIQNHVDVVSILLKEEEIIMKREKEKYGEFDGKEIVLKQNPFWSFSPTFSIRKGA
ncbi:unnamed protein product [Larinioides sclopetarius]|uniref:Uncharacterized protein n=1 Tax=Larinioides sclopetarius TaxID=280406 RepID=A0AAV2AFA6_9ARAC